VKINDDAADQSDRNGTEAEEPPTPSEGGTLLEHTFEPGDHVIRWEMLPIAWPIQIHGIVLETAEDSVTLADFGLTAHQQPAAAGNADGVEGEISEHSEDATSVSTADTESTPVQPFIDHPVYQKSEEVVVAAWEKLRPKQEKRQRRRINVRTITDQKELNRWSKVNYGGKLFGVGGPARDKKATDAETPSGDNNNSSNPDAPSTNKATENKAAAWWRRVSSSSDKNSNQNSHTPKENETDDSERAVENSSPENGPARDKSPTNADTAVGDNSIGNPGAPSTNKATGNKAAAWWRRVSSSFDKNNQTSHTPKENRKDDSERAVEYPSPKDGAAKPSSDDNLPKQKMNPAMARLLQKKDQTSTPSADVSSSSKKTLPKSDPPKVILARTRFLLKHGESILPPYVSIPVAIGRSIILVLASFLETNFRFY